MKMLIKYTKDDLDSYMEKLYVAFDILDLLRIMVERSTRTHKRLFGLRKDKVEKLSSYYSISSSGGTGVVFCHISESMPATEKLIGFYIVNHLYELRNLQKLFAERGNKNIYVDPNLARVINKISEKDLEILESIQSKLVNWSKTSFGMEYRWIHHPELP